MLLASLERKPLRHKVLDFDIENRPLSYLGADFTTSEPTAIGWGWCHEDTVSVRLLTTDPRSLYHMLVDFVEMWDEADMVTGHYILRHDIPILNGSLIEHNLPPLKSKLVEDTKVHLQGFKGLSKSQENLSDMFGVDAPKVQMNTPKWREANRLTQAGLDLTEQRVVGDVIQHRKLRQVLRNAGLLSPPVLYCP